MRLVDRFIADVRGNFATMFVAVSISLILATGLSVDYSRQSSAHRHLQDIADATSLALAASKEADGARLRAMAEDIIQANRNPKRLYNVAIVDIIADADRVDVRLAGNIPATFMAIAGHETLHTTAGSLAERAVKGNVEVALILDNTWSMSEADPKGVTRIAALKKASRSLLNELLSTEDGAVRVGLVPYADYVNVGTANRGASWLDVPADYKREKIEATCEQKDVTSTPCLEYAPKRTCTRTIDGVPETYSCGGECTRQGEPKTESKRVCSGGQSAASFQWYGCVGSRMTGSTRLDDKSPTTRYPGYVETSQKCLNPLVNLTSSRAKLLTAVDDMIIRIDGYRPYTYIPAGLVWGLNVLNPGEPFEDAGSYDLANERPRKVAVLMTDGENTLRFRKSDGRHVEPSGNASQKASQLKDTNDDTLALCTYMKAQKIEIYTVAFMVEDATAKQLLEDCATDGEHYYDASDSDQLLAAFQGIGQSLRVVRLAR